MNSPVAVRRVILSLVVMVLTARPAMADGPPSQTLRPGTPLSAGELAQLLGAQVWKFDVAVPTGATQVEIGFSLKEKGRDARGFASGISCSIENDTKRELLIAIIPLGGTLHDAEKVRVVVSGFGVSAAGNDDNPFRKLAIGRPVMPEDNKDGTFDLIGGYAGSTVSSPLSSADKVLSLKIDAKKSRRGGPDK
jgi:hypothetical protein